MVDTRNIIKRILDIRKKSDEIIHFEVNANGVKVTVDKYQIESDTEDEIKIKKYTLTECIYDAKRADSQLIKIREFALMRVEEFNLI